MQTFYEGFYMGGIFERPLFEKQLQRFVEIVPRIQTVAPGTSLTVEAGVELLMARNTRIHVTGEIQMSGTPDNQCRESREPS